MTMIQTGYSTEEHGMGWQIRNQCIGVNKLWTLMKRMCEEGGLEGNFTICVYALHQVDIKEQEIINQTCHNSEDTLRQDKDLRMIMKW